MSTYIGLALCSRCHGGDPNCYVCHDPVEEEPIDPTPEEEFEQEVNRQEHLSDLKQDR
jgi:uncharacterized CHY-type Zn-finger protein